MRILSRTDLSPSGQAGRNLIALTALSVATTLCTFSLTAQQAPPNLSGFIAVTVTDPSHRFVTGLEQQQFVGLENGIARPVASFSDVTSSMSLAIVSNMPLAFDDNFKRPNDEVIQASSLSEALRQLRASKNERKAVIVTTGEDVRGIPAGIQAVRADPANVFRVAIEFRNQYLLRFQVSDPAAHVEVILKQPNGLPLLKAVSKAAF